MTHHWTVLTTEQGDEVSRFLQAIELHFRNENHLELQLGRALDGAVEREVLSWARDAGYLVHCVGEHLIVKRPSRHTNRPLAAKRAARRRDLG